MRLKTFSIIVAMAVISGVNHLALSQNQTPSPVQLPIITPATPEASKLISSIQYPVNYGQGVVNISIPLYEISVGDITIPISLSYNHKGLKPHEFTTYLGQGWTLNAEPAIYRKVNGKPDIDCKYELPPGSESQWKPYMERVQLVNDNTDGYPDEYFYSLASKSGSFMFKSPAPTSGVATFPYEPIKVTYSGGVFSITDDDGTVYKFERQEITDLIVGVSMTKQVPTGWKCTEIVSPKGNIKFSYVEKPTTAATISDYTIIEDEVNTGNGSSGYPRYMMYDRDGMGNFMVYSLMQTSGSGGPAYDMFEFVKGSEIGGGPQVVKTYKVKNQRVSRIDFPGGYILFAMTDNTNKTLSNITVHETSGALLRKIVLQHDLNIISTANYSADGKFPVLTAVEIQGAGSSVEERYDFEYYNTNSAPTAFPEPGFSQRSAPVNFWGYWSPDATSSTRRVHYLTHLDYMQVNFTQTSNRAFRTDWYFMIGNSLRMEQATTNGILKSITTRSGSVTEFTYESDRFQMSRVTGPMGPPNQFGQKTYSTGGLRIAKIRQWDDTDNSVLEREFKYGTANSPESGLGILSVENITPDHYTTTKYITPASGPRIRQQVISSSLKGGESFSGAPVGYEYATEYSKGYIDGQEHIFGKTVYNYNYSTVTSRLHPTYKVPMPDKFRDFTQGALKSQEIYKYDPSSKLYTKIQKTEYERSYYPKEVLRAAQVHVESTTFTSNSSQGQDNLVMIGPWDINSGATRITKQTDTFYTDMGTVVTETSYGYGNQNHLYPTSTTVSTSNSATRKTDFVYALEAPGTGTAEHIAALTKMRSDNILRPVIQQTETFGTTKRTTYNSYTSATAKSPSGLPVLNILSVADSRNNNVSEQRIVYHKYDAKGNPVYATKDNITNVVYLWGYDRMHLVAVIENATEAEVTSAIGSSPATIAVSDSNINTVFNNLRNNSVLKSKAHITTFKYKPLVGVTEITDPRGAKTTYEYDNNGRLKTIKDDQGNKTNDYIYNLKNN